MGQWVETEEGIEAVATEYFHHLFSSSNPENIDDTLRFITAAVNSDMNQQLLKIPNDEEIRQATFAINPEKAPGPDGMTNLFYQRFWSTIGPDICTMVRNFYETGELDERLNQTNICLIPKTDRPATMTEFRPISLCNVGYKIISKILSSRLKRILPELISETQSAFVAKRLITDNILVAQEMFHALRTNPSCKEKFIAVKTDMSKAYDRVEWRFMEALLLKFGFDHHWVGLIMKCISSVSYQVLINGEAKGHIMPSRGLRQGDPLSPFLFILCTEVLISHIKHAESSKAITGIKIARENPPISHLLFADDSLFFCRADQPQCEELMRIIDVYGKASGQQLNKSKSSVLFGSKVVASSKQGLKRSLGITREGGMGMYLGMPEKICGSKNQVFSFVQERMNGNINNWSGKLLSRGGKEVQIKSVAQATPTYVMSCYLVPQGICKKLSAAVARFWWSTKENNRGLHWVAWDKICVPIDEGGLGFRDFRDFNLALLAKQVWRLLVYPNSLLARVLKGRYYRHSNPLRTGKAHNPSYGWRSLMAAKHVLEGNLCRTIGTGARTKVWEDVWIPGSPARPARPAQLDYDPDLRVHHLIDFETKQWDEAFISEVIDAVDIPLILDLKISKTGRHDGYVWKHTLSGNYTVKTGYEVAVAQRRNQSDIQVSEPSIRALKTKVWKLKTARKIKHFLWLALSGFVASASKLVERHCGTDTTCQRCGSAVENINHILFECPPALQCWALSDIPSPPGLFPCSSLFVNFDYLLQQASINSSLSESFSMFPWLVWYIWKARNDKCFNGKDISPVDTLQLATQEAIAWKIAQLGEPLEDSDVTTMTQTNQPTGTSSADIWTCQVDGSWSAKEEWMGLGFVLFANEEIILEGQRCCTRAQAPLHAEAESLSWAMKEVTNRGFHRVRFESDCQQLVNIILKEEEWPSMANEIEDIKATATCLQKFELSYISRSLNFRADSLAKGGRSRALRFENVNTLVHQGLAHAAGLNEPV